MVLCFSGLVSTKPSCTQIAVSKGSSTLAFKCVAEQSTAMDVIEKQINWGKYNLFQNILTEMVRQCWYFNKEKRIKWLETWLHIFFLYPVCPSFASDNVYTGCFFHFLQKGLNSNIPFMKILLFYFTVCGFMLNHPWNCVNLKLGI